MILVIVKKFTMEKKSRIPKINIYYIYTYTTPSNIQELNNCEWTRQERFECNNRTYGTSR